MGKIWKAFLGLVWRDYIPPLPRGMLATDYADVPSEERRVMARVGARDPKGVKVAMKRYGVNTVDELVAILEHHQPKRNVMHRIYRGIARVVGGTPYDPHAETIRREMRNSRKRRNLKEIQQRVKRTSKKFQEKNS